MNQVFRYLLLMLSSLEFFGLQTVGYFIPLFTMKKFKQKSATKKTSVNPIMNVQLGSTGMSIEVSSAIWNV